jgi:hypothetical protein
MFGKKYVWVVELKARRYCYREFSDTPDTLSEIVGIFAKKSDAYNWTRNYGSRYVSNMMHWFSFAKLSKWHVCFNDHTSYANVCFLDCVSDTSKEFSTDFREYAINCELWLHRKELRHNGKSLGTFYEERDPKEYPIDLGL